METSNLRKKNFGVRHGKNPLNIPLLETWDHLCFLSSFNILAAQDQLQAKWFWYISYLTHTYIPKAQLKIPSPSSSVASMRGPNRVVRGVRRCIRKRYLLPLLETRWSVCALEQFIPFRTYSGEEKKEGIVERSRSTNKREKGMRTVWDTTTSTLCAYHE